jgi:hypothetical protein
MKPPMRSHGISPEPFPVYSPDLRIKVTIAFWDFVVYSQLIRLIRLTIRFLSVEPRFRYCFFSPAPHDANLASRYQVRRQLRPLGLSPKVRDMPVIRLKERGRRAPPLRRTPPRNVGRRAFSSGSEYAHWGQLRCHAVRKTSLTAGKGKSKAGS